MYSLNVPVPSPVATLAGRLARELPRARSRRQHEHTLVVKRLGAADRQTFQRLAAKTRDTLAGFPAFEARITGVDYFAQPASGASPVVYLAVESPGIERLHDTLTEVFDPVADIEGEAYVPHVTIARGGSLAAARALAEQSIEPIEWTVSALVFWDGERAQSAGKLTLPA